MIINNTYCYSLELCTKVKSHVDLNSWLLEVKAILISGKSDLVLTLNMFLTWKLLHWEHFWSMLLYFWVLASNSN